MPDLPNGSQETPAWGFILPVDVLSALAARLCPTYSPAARLAGKSGWSGTISYSPHTKRTD